MSAPEAQQQREVVSVAVTEAVQTEEDQETLKKRDGFQLPN